MSLEAYGRAFGRGASALGKLGESAEGWLEGRTYARLLHRTAQNPLKDIMAQRGQYHQGRASHAVVDIRAAQGGPVLHCGGTQG
jgi:hypothetical protein